VKRIRNVPVDPWSLDRISLYTAIRGTLSSRSFQSTLQLHFPAVTVTEGYRRFANKLLILFGDFFTVLGTTFATEFADRFLLPPVGSVLDSTRDESVAHPLKVQFERRSSSMKSVVVVCALFLAMSATCAFADTIGFDNQGVMAASGFGGVTVLSTVNGLHFNGNPVMFGDIGFLVFSTGSLTGSFDDGGAFSAGALAIQLTGFPAAIFSSNFTGTWTHLSGDLFELLGTFSGNFEGIQFHGSSDQFFRISFSDGEACFRDLNGSTTLTTVPEPGTLALLGTGLIGLSGAIRRRFQRAAN